MIRTKQRGAVALFFVLGTIALHAAEVRIGAHLFTLPDGFEIELVAAPPLVERPISAAFDEAGRLYVSDSSGSNDKVEKQLAEKPHRIVRLEDADGDGRFDRQTVFADKMMLPQGAMWLDGSLYVAAPPSIWKLTDTDDDGVADQREEWFKGKTLTGCANDLHGPYAGPDGWIYWCKGAFAEQTHEQPGRTPIKDRAAHIFRCRRDGSGLESVMSGGMDNPVEIAFTRTGEPIFTSTFIDLSGGGKRDGLGHAIYGGVFGKQHDVVDGLRRTGELLPAMTHFGPGAPSGLCRSESAVFGAEYRDNFFATLFNLHKVTRHVLVPNGATFRTEDSDFVVSDNLDFHPTDVLEDADGGLLIVDTGGWYKLCCPTSQLAKPDVLGAIYRVRKKGEPRVDDPHGEKIAWSSLDAPALVTLLSDPRPAVAQRAVDHLVAKKKAGVAALADGLASAAPAEVKQHALWVLGRVDDPAARAAVRQALEDGTPAVRQTAAKIVSVARDAEARGPLAGMLGERGDATAHSQRVAAEALGRIGGTGAVPVLLETAGTNESDQFLEHAIVFALIEIGNRDAILDRMPLCRTDRGRRAAFIALSELGGAEPDIVVPMLGSESAGLRETARWIVGRHDDWGGALAEFLRDRLAAAEGDPGDVETLLARSAKDPAIQNLVAQAVESGRPAARALAVRVIERADLKTLPPSWIAPLSGILRARTDGLFDGALRAAARWASRKDAPPALLQSLLEIAQDAALPTASRFAAIRALPPASIPGDASLFRLLREQLASEVPTTRSAAASVLAAASLDEEQRGALVEMLPQMQPLEISRLLPVLAAKTSDIVGRRLLAVLRESPGFVDVPPQTLRDSFARLPEKLRSDAEALLAQLDGGTAQQRARLEAIAAELPAGDVRRGHAIFQSAKAACAMCHAVGYLGGKLGPDLSAIAQVRTERDLLEAIIFPSASFVRSYEPVGLRTTSGEELLGILRAENDEAVTLATSPAEERRVSRQDVAAMQPGAISLMPAGYDQILSRQEIADVVAFLSAGKPKAR